MLDLSLASVPWVVGVGLIILVCWLALSLAGMLTEGEDDDDLPPWDFQNPATA